MGKITLSSKEVLGAVGALEALQGAKASGKFKLKLARAAAVLRADAERIQAAIMELQREYIVLDDKGVPVPLTVAGHTIPNAVQWKDKTGYDKAEKELLEAPGEFDVPQFTADEIDSLEVNGSIEGILPLLAA